MQAIIITHRRGAYSPLTYSANRNIIELRLVGNEALSLRDDEDFCFIRYHKDPFIDVPLLTVDEMDFLGQQT